MPPPCDLASVGPLAERVDGGQRRPEALPGDEIHLWLSRSADVDDRCLEECRTLVSVDEFARAERCRLEVDKRLSILTRALVRTVLSRYADVDPRDWRFETNEFGCPRVSDDFGKDAGPSFNISHCRGRVVMAVAQSIDVGVDVESTARPAPLDIARRYFSADEAASLFDLPVECRSRRFFDYWTLKESYLKARKRGLSIPLDQFGFEFDGSGQVALCLQPGLGDSSSRWQFWQFTGEGDAVIALCAANRPIRRIVARAMVPGAGESVLELQGVRRSAAGAGTIIV